jgi:hypothetical protein
MDGERVGPLSYDVTAPEGETSAQKAIVYGALTIAGLMFLSLVGGWFALGWIESAPAIVNGAPLLILGAALAVALLHSRDSTRRTRRTALVTVLGLALLSAFFTNKVLADVKPAMPQIRQTLDDIDLPAGFAMVEEETFGDRMCRRGCPRVERVYTTPPGDPDPVSTLILAMFDQGWRQNTDIDPKLATVALKDGLTAHLSTFDNGTVKLRVTRR